VNVEEANNVNDDVVKMTLIAYQQLIIMDKYRKIKEEDKWTLSTEKTVEDALYAFGMKCSHEQ